MLKYKSLMDFKKDYPNEYLFLHNKNLVDKLCEDMGWVYRKIKPNGYWDIKENVISEALKYNKIIEWSSNNSASIKSAKINGWFDECTAHMKKQNLVPKSYWTKERCFEESKKYTSKSIWAKNSDSSYRISKENDWFDECTAHMVELQKPKGYWNIQQHCIDEALKYKTRTEWTRKSSGSCQAAKRNGWYDVCIKHMVNYE
jgi:hypothetical protein